MTLKQRAVIERARKNPARLVEMEKRRRTSFTAEELRNLRQGNWADKERERLLETWKKQ
jgi:hypothetical protein